MKKTIAILLALLMLLSLAACDGGNTTNNASVASAESENTPAAPEAEAQVEPEPEPEPTYSLGEKVSTDIIEFTLDSAQFSYYATDDDRWYKPVDYNCSHCLPIAEPDGGKFVTNTGRCFVCMTYTIKNKDRGDCNWGFFPFETCYLFTPSIKYGGEEYSIRSFNKAYKDGQYMSMGLGDVAFSYDNGKIFKGQVCGGVKIEAGHTIIIRTLGVVVLEPDNIEDGFEMTVNIPTSSGADEYFTYVIE